MTKIKIISLIVGNKIKHRTKMEKVFLGDKSKRTQVFYMRLTLETIISNNIRNPFPLRFKNKKCLIVYCCDKGKCVRNDSECMVGNRDTKHLLHVLVQGRSFEEWKWIQVSHILLPHSFYKHLHGNIPNYKIPSK